MSAHDVIVIGLGGMGSAAAAHLAARGQKVLGLERFGPAHDRGASHGGSRVIRQSYFEDPAYVPLLVRAYELWAALAADSGRDVVTLTGGAYLGRPDSATVAGSLLAAQAWDLPHEVLDAAQVRRRFPTLAPEPDEVALVEEQAGFVRPEQTVLAHLELAAARGAELHYDEPVLRWAEARGGGVVVTTAAGSYTADHLVVCPGPWAPQLLADLGVDFTIERQVMHWFQPVGGTGPWSPSVAPVYIHEAGDDAGEWAGSQVYGFPAIDGPDGGAKVAFFRRGEVCTPESVDRAIRPDDVTSITQRVARVLPTLAGRHLDAATCLYSNTPDQHFVIATHPGHARVTVACGFSGHGFKFVPVVGEVLADLATTGTTAHPLHLFDPRRFAPEDRPAPPASPSAQPAGASP